MQILLAPLFGALGIGGEAAAAGAAAGGAAGAAGSGISLTSILQGTATVLGVVSSIGAGAAQADQANAAAIDAETEQGIETLQGINRRTSIKRQLAAALGAQDVAYAASGVDLSFGTARAARTDAYREADLGLTTATGTEMSRVSRLAERAANYRSAAKTARRMGFFNALSGATDNLLSFTERY